MHGQNKSENAYRQSLTGITFMLFIEKLITSRLDKCLMSCPTVSMRMTLDFNTVAASLCEYVQKRNMDSFYYYYLTHAFKRNACHAI